MSSEEDKQCCNHSWINNKFSKITATRRTVYKMVTKYCVLDGCIGSIIIQRSCSDLLTIMYWPHGKFLLVATNRGHLHLCHI